MGNSKNRARTDYTLMLARTIANLWWVVSNERKFDGIVKYKVMSSIRDNKLIAHGLKAIS